MPASAAAPLVSVVTATYAGDDPAQLAQSVDSVVAQTYRPLELLIVCDGPVSQRTEAMLAERSQWHPWISVHRHTGRPGPGAARNAVLGRCRGEYIAILDADDLMTPDRIATQVAFLGTHDVDLVASWLDVIDQSGRSQGVRRFPIGSAQVRAQAPLSCPTANTAATFRRRLLRDFHYPEDLAVGEDYRLWVRLLREGYRIANLDRPLTRYRTGSDYFRRRRGWQYASSDAVTKLHALPLVAWWRWPVVVAVAGATFVVRLLPDRLFRLAYARFERAGRGAPA